MRGIVVYFGLYNGRAFRDAHRIMYFQERKRFETCRSDTLKEEAAPYGKPKLLARLRQALRERHYGPKTEKAYAFWVKRYIFFHDVRHPAEMGEAEINTFLTHLAINEKVSASTQNQPLAALLFLYRYIFGEKIGDLGEVVRARKPIQLLVVLTRDEVKLVLANQKRGSLLMASLMHEAGLRLTECLELRVQNFDFSKNEILVRNGKGAKDRIAILLESLKTPVQEHLKLSDSFMKKICEIIDARCS